MSTAWKLFALGVGAGIVVLAARTALLDNLLFQPRATFTRNWSNIALYDYERWSTSATLRFEF